MAGRTSQEMTIIDLDGDTLCVCCPSCGHTLYMTERFLARRYPTETRLLDIAARMYCRRCSVPGGPRIYADAHLIDYPRSGAEGRNAPSRRWADGAGHLKPS